MLFVLKSILFAFLFTVILAVVALEGTDLKRKTFIILLTITFFSFFGILLWYGEQSFNDLIAHLAYW